MSWIQMVAAIIISVTLSTMIAASIVRKVTDRILGHMDGLYEVVKQIIEKLNSERKPQ